jgi:hypothetical protein
MSIPFLGRVPLTLAIRRMSDAGTPPAAEGERRRALPPIAERLDQLLNQRVFSSYPVIPLRGGDEERQVPLTTDRDRPSALARALHALVGRPTGRNGPHTV